MTKKLGGIIISSVMPNSPAEAQGLEAGDIILKVKDLVCTYETYYDCIDLIKYKEPSTVHIVYSRNGEVLEGDFTTEVVNSNTTVSDVINENIGYIRIYSFDSGVSKEFKNEYEKLKAQNIEGLIVDLRNNPGGLVSETYTILKSILPQGVIVKMVYKDGTEKVYDNKIDNKLDIPLVVLVNENSASASEIFAGAVKDLDAGEIVGTKTYGKGIVQSVEKLRLSSGAVSITNSRYYTASGHEIHKNGIEPDIEVVAKDEYKNKWYIPRDEDLELQKAIEVIASETQK